MSRQQGTSPVTKRVHFWLDSESDARAIADWDPDLEPQLFASGESHSISELYVRLRQRGHAVTIGPRVHPQSQLVVWYPDFAGAPRSTLRRVFRLNPYPNVLVRSDRPLSWRPSSAPDMTVVPNGDPIWDICADDPWVYLPHLPQRGLLPRDVSRGGQISRVHFKGNPENLPDFVRTDRFRNALKDVNIELFIDVPVETNGLDQTWHDFRDCDVVLCIRTKKKGQELRHKPATRLVNAWLAGVVPIINDEPAYLEMCDPWKDALIAESEYEIIEILRRLKGDHNLISVLESNIRIKQIEWNRNNVIDFWESLLFERYWPIPGFQQRFKRLIAELPRLLARLVLGSRIRNRIHNLKEKDENLRRTAHEK